MKLGNPDINVVDQANIPQFIELNDTRDLLTLFEFYLVDCVS